MPEVEKIDIYKIEQLSKGLSYDQAAIDMGNLAVSISRGVHFFAARGTERIDEVMAMHLEGNLLRFSPKVREVTFEEGEELTLENYRNKTQALSERPILKGYPGDVFQVWKMTKRKQSIAERFSLWSFHASDLLDPESSADEQLRSATGVFYQLGFLKKELGDKPVLALGGVMMDRRYRLILYAGKDSMVATSLS